MNKNQNANAITRKSIGIFPAIARKIGFNSSLVFVSLQTELTKASSVCEIEGKLWVAKPLCEWREKNFPFWSEGKIKHMFTSMLLRGIVESRVDANGVRCHRLNEDKAEHLIQLMIEEAQSAYAAGRTQPAKKIRAAKRVTAK